MAMAQSGLQRIRAALALVHGPVHQAMQKTTRKTGNVVDWRGQNL
jgi:hypothetical protein